MCGGGFFLITFAHCRPCSPHCVCYCPIAYYGNPKTEISMCLRKDDCRKHFTLDCVAGPATLQKKGGFLCKTHPQSHCSGFLVVQGRKGVITVTPDSGAVCRVTVGVTELPPVRRGKKRKRKKKRQTHERIFVTVTVTSYP